MTQLDQTHPDKSFEEFTMDLKELGSILWEGKYFVLVTTAVVALGAMLYASSLPNYYTSTSFVSIQGTDNAGSISSGFGGLAAAAGINLTLDVKGPLVVNTIRSRGFLQHLMSIDENVLPAIVAVENYDSESKKLVFNSDIYDAANKKWLITPPTNVEAFGAYMKIINIEYREIRRMINLEVEHLSPIFAKEFLDLLIREVDDLIRNNDMQRSSEALTFLYAELSRTSVLEVKSSINSLIVGQLKTKMMAKVSKNYILNVIEPAFVPIHKSKPSRSLIVMLFTVTAFGLGIIWIVMRHFITVDSIKQTSEPKRTAEVQSTVL